MPIFIDMRGGFSLLELMLVISIFAALLLLAAPAWQHYLQQQARANARQNLLSLAQKLEHYHSLSGSYALSLNAHLPVDSHYQYSFQGSAQDDSYILQAEPIGSQMSDACGTLLLNAIGQRGAGGVLEHRAALTLRCWPS